MTADKIALKAELYDLFVNLGFGAAYICDDTVILYDILKLCEVFDILFTGAHRKITSQSLNELSFKSSLLSIRPSPKASSMVC